ncbi:MAG: UDP-glucose/GDP-mannose dehydrogenase family protein [Halioglobus sp.]
MGISVIGTGYVGLVTGTCLAEMGHSVVCVDIDAEKILGLQAGRLPIYEPGLQELVESNLAEGRLRFTTSLKEAVEGAEVHFIAVGTPPLEDGSSDLQYVMAVAKQLGETITGDYNVIVDKSTVPVGTGLKVGSAVAAELETRAINTRFDVVSNPEFLREGVAIEDFMRPDRVVIGTDQEKAFNKVRQLYAPFMRNHEVIMRMGLREAEMTKYAANALLATKISFMNEIAAICEKSDVDVESVRLGIGADHRIGYHFIYAGCGYGGSCFPKDVKAIISMAETGGVEPALLSAVEARNEMQKQSLPSKIFSRLGSNLEGKVVALWGLAFKPGTDDIREAPALTLISELVKAGACVNAYDPVATQAARKALDNSWEQEGKIQFFEHQYEALDGADVLVLVTEWKPFRNPDFDKIKKLLKLPLIFDGRNQYDPSLMLELGIEYRGIGRGLQG